jgi:uncharacterized protein (TIGR02453 family)
MTYDGGREPGARLTDILRQPRSHRPGGDAGAGGLARPCFSPKAVPFLRALKRNNDREWFRARKDSYEVLLHQPMIVLIERLARDFRTIGPEFVANPKTSLFRIYRDTRFSEDKSPLKTNVAAIFPHRLLPRMGGACLYFEVRPARVWIGGGLHAPDTSRLQMIREHLAANFRRFRTIVESPAFRRTLGGVEGGQLLQRTPRGFPQDHPAAAYLRYRMFIAGREFPSTFASSPRFYPTIVSIFRQTAPLVRFLNEPLLKG